MLQSISINLSTFTSGVQVNLAGGKAEGLKHLKLHEGLLPWSSNLLRNLETLTTYIRDTVPAEEILNLLATNPALRHLELLCEGADNPTAPATQSLDAVATSLKKVVIHVAHPHLIARVLSQVSLPRCNDVALSADFTTLEDLRSLDPALAQFGTRIRETLSLGGRTTLQVSSDSEFEWSSPLEYEAFEFSFGFSGTDLGQLIEWIRHLSATLEAPLELEISLTTPDRQTLQALGEWSEVTKMNIPGMASPDDVEEALSLHDLLGNPLVDPIGGLSWNFPSLRELDVYFAQYDLLSILGMLNKRYLPAAYVTEMDGLGISIHTPPQIDLRVKGSTEPGDFMIMEALRRHRGVKTVDGRVDGRWFANE
ncbi:hypothetical protein FRC01_011783 [Tulasnella sp. 417]|nr:hypothetical protein FRC01_011783 [Tulasnella sp. 417]